MFIRNGFNPVSILITNTDTKIILFNHYGAMGFLVPPLLQPKFCKTDCVVQCQNAVKYHEIALLSPPDATTTNP